MNWIWYSIIYNGEYAIKQNKTQALSLSLSLSLSLYLV